MEEDIKILEEMKNNCLNKRDYIDKKAERKAQAIENLINKNKELRQEVAEHERREAQQDQNMVSTLEEALKYCFEIKDLEEKNKELEKVVELMAEWISNNCFYSDAYSNSCEIIQDSCYKNLDCKKCIIDYFKKKASDENGIKRHN